MKKQRLLFAVLILSLVCPMLAFGQKTHQLDSRVLKDYEEYYFRYDGSGHLDSLYLSIEDNQPYKSYRLYTYNEKGLCTREDDYQYLADKGDFVHVSYIDYGYDEQGRMISRLNYNSFGTDNFEVGGKLVWTYNENGTIKTMETYLSSWTNPGEWELFLRDEYIYFTDMRLKEIHTSMVPYGGTEETMFISKMEEFKYDDKKQFIENSWKEYKEDGNGVPVSTGRSTYTYDELGNMIQFDSFIGLTSQNPVVRYKYEYDTTIKSENTNLPYNYEDERLPFVYAFSLSPNVVVKEDWWQQPMETDRLEFIGTYTWTYSNAGSGSGIGNMNVDLNSVNYFVNSDVLYFTNLREGTEVQIYDVKGSVVLQSQYQAAGISLNNLPEGVYIGRVRGHKIPVKFVK